MTASLVSSFAGCGSCGGRFLSNPGARQILFALLAASVVERPADVRRTSAAVSRKLG